MTNIKKILIVEDDQALRLVLKDALQKEGYEVWDAEDGQMALEIIEKFSPNLALIDIEIPKIDGLTLSGIMAEKKYTDTTKILFLTNSSDLGHIATASKTEGVLGYLIKADWDISAVVNQIKAKI